MCAHMNVMSINGVVSQYSMTIIRQPRGDTLHKLSEQIKTIFKFFVIEIIKLRINFKTKEGVRSLYTQMIWFHDLFMSE